MLWVLWRCCTNVVDTKRAKVDDTKAVDNAGEEDIEEPKPEIPEKEERNEGEINCP